MSFSPVRTEIVSVCGSRHFLEIDEGDDGSDGEAEEAEDGKGFNVNLPEHVYSQVIGRYLLKGISDKNSSRRTRLAAVGWVGSRELKRQTAMLGCFDYRTG